MSAPQRGFSQTTASLPMHIAMGSVSSCAQLTAFAKLNRSQVPSALRRTKRDVIDGVKDREITTHPESIGSEHAVRTLRIRAAPRAVFGLPKQFALRAPANQNL